MSNRGGRQGWVRLLTLAVAVCGVIAIAVAVAAQTSPPTPSASARGKINAYKGSGPKSPHHPAAAGSGVQAPGPSKRSNGKATDQAGPTRHGLALAASKPVSVDIPSIRVHTPVIPIGKNPNGTLRVPQEGPNLNKAAWYKDSPTPGQKGPSIIEGHIDSIHGPSVFYLLGALKPGDLVRVTRADHMVAVFTVNAVRDYATKASFPTQIVYGGDLVHPTLRLITCNNFDESTGHYAGNTVVFAHLTAVHPVRRGAAS